MSFAQFGLRVCSFLPILMCYLTVQLVLMASRVVVCFFGVAIYNPALLIVMDIRLFWPVCHHRVVTQVGKPEI